MAEKNGNDPWIFAFVRPGSGCVVLDFDGARRLCETVTDTATTALARQPQARQPRTIARLARGYASWSADITMKHRDTSTRSWTRP